MKTNIEISAEYIDKAVSFRNGIFDKIISRDKGRIWAQASLRDVRKVLIIDAASRSGSSLLFSLLRKDPHFYSLSGESTPFYKLNGFSSDSFSSDEVPEELTGSERHVSGLSRDFLSDFSLESDQSAVFDEDALLGQYIDDLALRFPLQWPQLSFSYDIFKRLAMQAFDLYKSTHRSFCKEEFYLELLQSLRGRYKTINPYYYDIPADMVRKKFPGVKIPVAAPNDILMIEEPPFILLSPRRKIGSEDLSNKILLLKTTADCYRMHFIESLLPGADIKIIRLVRNPAASINGLYDGWLYRGFFSHNLKNYNALAIAGYSDRYEWGKWWWKYDLPPGWQEYARLPLQEVCAFQWYSANRAIQEYINKGKKQHCLVRYEDLNRSHGLGMDEIGRISDFVGAPLTILKKSEFDKMPFIQATHPPGPYYWKKREDILLPLVDDRKISSMCAELGYDRNKIEEWM